MSQDFILKPQYAEAIRWSRRGSCGNSGCPDKGCRCSFCDLPIGVDEEDPRWNKHPESCVECDLCRDQVPAMLFRGTGKATEGAQFHWNCFRKIVLFRSIAASQTTPTAPALPTK